MVRNQLALLCILNTALPAAEVDLVKLGKETFHAVGCAECHSETKNDTSVKTGPGLFGLFPKDARKREIVNNGQTQKKSITADFAYYQKSLRDPATEITISEAPATKGTPFLPVMPAYPESFLGEQKAKAIYHYLQTLNDQDKQGPTKVMAELEEGTTLKDIHQDPSEILVTDRTRIFRARIKGSSARAIYVGMPGAFNFAFDPRTMTISKAWTGGFLNLKEEMSGRGGKISKLGHKASEITLSNQPTIHPPPLTFHSSPPSSTMEKRSKRTSGLKPTSPTN